MLVQLDYLLGRDERGVAQSQLGALVHAVGAQPDRVGLGLGRGGSLGAPREGAPVAATVLQQRQQNNQTDSQQVVQLINKRWLASVKSVSSFRG